MSCSHCLRPHALNHSKSAFFAICGPLARGRRSVDRLAIPWGVYPPPAVHTVLEGPSSRVVLKSRRVSDKMAVILKRNCHDPAKYENDLLMTLRSTRMTFLGPGRRHALPGSIAMLRMVSPELKVYTISDREALSELVAGLRLDSTLASNLREVLGLQTVGNGGRQGRQMAGNWPRLHSVVRSAPAQTRARSGRGQQCDPHFQTVNKRCCPQTPDAR